MSDAVVVIIPNSHCGHNKEEKIKTKMPPCGPTKMERGLLVVGESLGGGPESIFGHIWGRAA